MQVLVNYESNCGKCEAECFGKSKRSLKSCSDEHKRSVKYCDCEKNEIVKHGWDWEADHNFSWDQNKVVDRQSRLNYQKIKETIHSLRNLYHTNKISIWFLKYGFVIYDGSWLLIYFTPVDSN